MNSPIKYSVVVPVYNEAGNIEELHQRLVKVMEALPGGFELVYVDDGSKDATPSKLANLRPAVVVSFRKNFGQTAALDAGIKQAKGDIVVTLDSDLQNPPEEIPKLLAYMEAQQLDVVSGWRKKRHDSFSKRFVSRGAHWLRTIFLQDGIHDSGCTLKAYKRYCFEDVDLFGESHRFIPGILKLHGFSVGEVEVNHQPRKSGTSKYGTTRIVKGFVDMIGLWFWRNYSHRPLHLFGGSGLGLMLGGTVLLALLAIARLIWEYPLSTSIWPLVAVLAIITGLQLFIMGLVSEVLIKTYYSDDRKPYTIKHVKQQ